MGEARKRPPGILDQVGPADAPAAAEILERILESLEDGIWATDPTGRTFFFNTKMAEMLGFAVDELGGNSLGDFVHSDTKLRANVLQAPTAKGSVRQDIPLRRKDGSKFWTAVTTSPLTVGDKTIGWINCFSDISRRKARETRLQQQSDLFRQFGDAVRDVAYVMNWPDNEVTYVNPAYARVWGRSAEQLQVNPLDWIEAIHEDDRERVQRQFLHNVEQGSYDEVFRIVRPDGSVRWIRDRAFPVRDALGRVHRVAGLAEDVTETHYAKQFRTARSKILEVLTTGEPLQRILDTIARVAEDQCEGLWASILLRSDDGGRLFHGAAPNLPREYNDALDGMEIGPAAASCGTAAHRGEQVIVDDVETDPLWARYREQAAAARVRSAWSQPIFDSDRKLLGVLSICSPHPRKPQPHELEVLQASAHIAGIAIERKRREMALHEGERNLRQIIDLVPHMIYVKDRRGCFLMANRVVADAYGCSADALTGRSHADLHGTHEELDSMLIDDLEVIDGGRPKFVPEEPFVDHRGRRRLLQSTKIPFKLVNSNEPAVLGLGVDITERRRLERQLSSYEENLERFFLNDVARGGRSKRLRELYDSAGDFFVTLLPDTTVVEVNKAFADGLVLNPDEIAGQPMTRFVTPDCRPGLIQALDRLEDSDALQRIECDLLRADGSRVETLLNAYVSREPGGEVAEIRAVLHDVARRKSLHRHLVHTEQLVTTGRLAASVAHEINNPLQALLMHLSLVGQSLPATFAERESWDRIQEGIGRIHRVVNDLLDLHRMGRSRPENVDLNSLIHEALGLAESQLRASQVVSQVELDAELPPVRGVPQHLYQVILNLFLNAADAMYKGGDLHVVTRQANGNAVLEVEDTGAGISPEELPRVFDPLYAGRRSHGSGLGLFVTYNLVKEHRGEIEVESRLGQGTLVRIRLPLSAGSAAPDSTDAPTR
ncbi:MAG: PAS domain S-box protein [bacterium]|nr:PAS domain S-box protein [bacterium]